MAAFSRDGALYAYLRAFRSKITLTYKRLPSVHTSSSIHRTCKVARDLTAAEYVFLGEQCRIGPLVTIGRYSMLAPGVCIVGDDHNVNQVGTPMQFAGRPNQQSTTIGADVWIGQSSLILRGVTIADGAVIGAGSVVTKDVPPCEIWAGMPARKLRDRFSNMADTRRHMDTISGPLAQPAFAQPIGDVAQRT